LEQIKSLKDENKDTKNKVNNPENEEFSRIKNHNQNLLTQIISQLKKMPIQLKKDVLRMLEYKTTKVEHVWAMLFRIQYKSHILYSTWGSMVKYDQGRVNVGNFFHA
jgi:hypothetical protein